MLKTLHLKADVPKSREVTVVLPQEVPPGPADLVVLIDSLAKTSRSTLGDFLRSEFFGSWRGRSDLGQGTDFTRRLREEGWKRPS